ncbi:hypothetical protein [Rothia nasimurium]|uniref:hypothetical protein n=1 Tax=Rothia nasimurium TaxID=85336 RepID=UPI001F2C4E43|nr:hypothetical protein [Rothia nasimurium]
MTTPILTAATPAHNDLQAAGLFDTINNLVTNTQATLGGVLVVVGLLVFIIAAWRTKTIPGIIGGLVAGGIIAGAGAIIIALSGVFTQTIQETNTATANTTITQAQHTNELV